MFLQTDGDLVNQFYRALIAKAAEQGVPVRDAGSKQEVDERTGVAYLYAFYFQVGMQKFELFCNINVVENRWGWREVGLF